jgi:hypothetical protein
MAVVVLAFSTDPVVRWGYPDPHQYLMYFPDIVRAFAGKAFEQQTAYYVLVSHKFSNRKTLTALPESSMNSPELPAFEHLGSPRRIHAEVRISRFGELSKCLFPSPQLVTIRSGGVEFSGRPGDVRGDVDVSILARG